MSCFSRKIAVATVALSCLLPGCGEQTPAPPPAPQAQKVQPVQAAPAPEPPADVPPEANLSFAYDPAGRRDPFEPLVLIRKPVNRSDLPQTPLQTFDIGQLRLIGVIVGKGDPKAMVVAPDGKAYILQRGVLIGKNNGRVKDIRSEAVLVEEKYVDLTGEVRTGMQEIRLPKREGVL